MSLPPISPVLAAALEAGLTPWLVIPNDTDCPDCAVDRLVREQCPTCTWGVVLGIEDEMPCPDCGGACFVEVPGVVPAHLTGDCPTCDGSGRALTNSSVEIATTRRSAAGTAVPKSGASDERY